MDVLICPVSSVNGTPHDVKPWWGYGSQWNLLDYPAGVLPAGQVLEGDAYPDGYQSANELDRENMELCKFVWGAAGGSRSRRQFQDADANQTTMARIWECRWLSR